MQNDHVLRHMNILVIKACGLNLFYFHVTRLIQLKRLQTSSFHNCCTRLCWVDIWHRLISFSAVSPRGNNLHVVTSYVLSTRWIRWGRNWVSMWEGSMAGNCTCVCERSMTNCSRFGSSDVGESKQGSRCQVVSSLLLKRMIPAAPAASPQTLVFS